MVFWNTALKIGLTSDVLIYFSTERFRKSYTSLNGILYL